MGFAGIIARPAALPETAHPSACTEFGLRIHAMEARDRLDRGMVVVNLDAERTNTSRFRIVDVGEIILFARQLDRRLYMIAAVFEHILVWRFKGVTNRLSAIECACWAIGDVRTTDDIVGHRIGIDAMHVIIVTAQDRIP